MIEPDTVKEIKAEEKAYSRWEREQKNLILSMSNIEKKQKMWHKLFPVPIVLEANEVF